MNDNDKKIQDLILKLNQEIETIQQDSEIILKLDEMIGKIISERDTNISKALNSIKETISHSENTTITDEDPLTVNMKKAIENRNITAESAEKEIDKRIKKIKVKTETFKKSLRFVEGVIGEEKFYQYIKKLETIEDSLAEFL